MADDLSTDLTPASPAPRPMSLPERLIADLQDDVRVLEDRLDAFRLAAERAERELDLRRTYLDRVRRFEAVLMPDAPAPGDEP